MSKFSWLLTPKTLLGGGALLVALFLVNSVPKLVTLGAGVAIGAGGAALVSRWNEKKQAQLTGKSDDMATNSDD